MSDGTPEPAASLLLPHLLLDSREVVLAGIAQDGDGEALVVHVNGVERLRVDQIRSGFQTQAFPGVAAAGLLTVVPDPLRVGSGW